MVPEEGFTSYHFSHCSDKEIEAYVSSDQAACLRSIQEPNGPVISPEYKVKPLTLDEQCKLLRGEEAYATFRDCHQGACWLDGNPQIFYVVENLECDSGNGVIQSV